MPRYMLILHDSLEMPSDISPEAIQAILEEYGAWTAQLHATGKHLGGEKLTDEPGRIVRGDDKGGMSVMDGPFSESKEIVGGYYLVEAANYDEAVGLVKECPHLKYGHRIEVRQVDELEGMDRP